MNEEKYKIFNYDPNLKIRILPLPSSDLEQTIKKIYYTRKIEKNETILEKIPIEEIERFLRKKKLEKIEKNK